MLRITSCECKNLWIYGDRCLKNTEQIRSQVRFGPQFFPMTEKEKLIPYLRAKSVGTNLT